MEKARVYVGADRSQLLAVRVLEHSIRRFSSIAVDVIPMVDLAVPVPADPRNGQRTGFSFSRFCIPQLAEFTGKAVYMDADMLVFHDIRELWEIPFNGAKVVIQSEVKFEDTTTRKEGAPKRRKKQCAVMILDCERLDWRIEDLVRRMDAGEFDYEGLMFDLCVLDDGDINYGVPFEWNSLEHWDEDTRLLHYTDMLTQPWVSTRNPLGDLWFNEVRLMLSDGSLIWSEVQTEIALGYFRPSLARDIKWRHLVPRALLGGFDRANQALDAASGYAMHKAVYEAKRARDRVIKEYERRLADSTSGPETATISR